MNAMSAIRLVTAAALLLAPDLSEAQAFRVDVLKADRAAARGDWRNAVPLYERAIRGAPGDYASITRLANCLLQLKENEAALRWTLLAAEIPSERPGALFNLAILYTRLGDRRRALDMLARAVDALGATGLATGENLSRNQDLAPLRDDPSFQAVIAKAYGPGYEPPESRRLTPQRIREGVELVLSTITSRSPNPYRYFTREQWRVRADRIIARAGELDEAGYFFELVALAGMAGDVHTSVRPERSVPLLSRSLPLRFWRFSDGLAIRATAPQQRRLLGARVDRFGDFDVERGWDELVRHFPDENRRSSESALSHYLLFPEFHRSRGWSQSPDAVAMTLRLADGETLRTQVSASEVSGYFAPMDSSFWLGEQPGFIDAAPGGDRAPLWMINRDRNYWYRVLPANSALYFAFNLPRDDPEKPFADFVDELLNALRTSKVHRLIIDLRNNPGGWGYMARDLTHAILGYPELNRSGRLVVLTSRATQSAGVIIAAALERETNAVFVGEPVGAAPNLFNSPMGNHPSWAVPGAPILFRFSSIVEQESDPLDTRNTIMPDAPVWMSFVDYAAGRDPVLERALGMTDQEAAAFLRDPGGRDLPSYAHWRRQSQAAAFPNGELPQRHY